MTATPKRDDGQEKKIFMQLGPIRFRYTAKDRAEKQGIGHFIYPRFTRLIVTEKGLKLAELNKLVIESEIRNLQIINDAAECVQNGRTPLIMTKQREHAQKLYDRLKDKAKHVFLLQGGNGAKARSELRQKMLKVPENETMLIVATGQYIGEGFNYPRLDTLLLAMPISWSGNVEQYAGRLNRDFDSKKNVIIYDYIDGHIPMLERMYQKRLRTYKKIGFDIYSQTSEKNEETNSIFGPEEYAATFERDIRAAKKRIIVSSPYTEKDVVNRFIITGNNIVGIGLSFPLDSFAVAVFYAVYIITAAKVCLFLYTKNSEENFVLAYV
ncbi:MAG: hypothetical protein IJR45_04045 [Firmicutes bacterium]|nr:hypothetical protein [Bacillota bacterium]